MAGRVNTRTWGASGTPGKKAMISMFPCLGSNVQLRIQGLDGSNVPSKVGDAGQWGHYEWPHKDDPRVKLERDDLLIQFANWGDWTVVDSNNKVIERLTEDERTALTQQHTEEVERRRHAYANRPLGQKIREFFSLGPPLDRTHRGFNEYVQE